MRAKTRQDGRIYLVGDVVLRGVQQTVRLLLFSMAALVASTSAQSGSPVPTVETIVARMGRPGMKTSPALVLTSSRATTRCLAKKDRRASPR